MSDNYDTREVAQRAKKVGKETLGQAEFTGRAVVVGAFIGLLVVTANMYMGLKIGFTEGYAILSAILCFAVVRALGGRLSMLENNIGQTLASGAASMGIMVSVVPALAMLGLPLRPFETVVWLLLVSVMGVLFAVPLRRQYVVMESLPFPTGTACATTIRAMHAQGEAGMSQARLLGLSGLASGLITWLRDGIPSLIPATSMFPFQLGGIPAGRLTLGVNWSPMLVGVGLLVGPRIGASLAVGGLAGSAVLGPILLAAGMIETPGHSQITHWTMWLAIPLMVWAGLVSLLLKARVVAAAFRAMGGASWKKGEEFPFGLWALLGSAVGVAMMVTMYLAFEVPIWMGLLAILLSFLLALIAVRAYGETDISPIGTMGHATQIVFGGVAPGQMLTNIVAAGITAGCANTAVDMMQDLKAGYLLGSTPRRQVYAQFIGVMVGALAAVPIFNTLVAAYGLGTEALPAPAAVLWSGMAKLLSQGFGALPTGAWMAVTAGTALGLLLAFLENSRWKKYTPSPLGIGIGLMVPAFFTITIFLGSLLALPLGRFYPKWQEQTLLPVASGAIAGEAVLGVLIAGLTVLAVL